MNVGSGCMCFMNTLGFQGFKPSQIPQVIYLTWKTKIGKTNTLNVNEIR